MGKKKQIIIGGDFNAHSMLWGSKYISYRGERLVRCMKAINLTLINKGKVLTCVRKQGNSIIDLTWATPQIAGKIDKWKMEEDELLLSDHNYITFNINVSRRIGETCVAAPYPRWKNDARWQNGKRNVLRNN